MTVHSAKGLEYKFVYIVGLEENLFPSQRAVESPDGFEEERRLFYVALTRAKELATLSYAEMRFKWGNMEFSRPSCFLREIDSRYLETDAMQEEREPVRRSAGRGEGSSALDELRRRFDTATSRSLRRAVRRPGRVSRRFVRRGKIGGAASRRCPADPFDGRDAQRRHPAGRIVAGRGSRARIVRRLFGRRPGVAPEVRRGGHPPHRNIGVGS